MSDFLIENNADLRLRNTLALPAWAAHLASIDSLDHLQQLACNRQWRETSIIFS